MTMVLLLFFFYLLNVSVKLMIFTKNIYILIAANLNPNQTKKQKKFI